MLLRMHFLWVEIGLALKLRLARRLLSATGQFHASSIFCRAYNFIRGTQPLASLQVFLGSRHPILEDIAVDFFEAILTDIFLQWVLIIAGIRWRVALRIVRASISELLPLPEIHDRLQLRLLLLVQRIAYKLQLSA